MNEKAGAPEKTGILNGIISKLTPKALAALIAMSLFSLTIVLSIAVYQGSDVSFFGIEIGKGAPSTGQEKIHVKLKLNFNPNEINPRSPGMQVNGYVKSEDGREIAIPIRHGVDQGGIYVEADVEVKTPFFVEVRTPSKGIWKTDDYSITQAFLTAYPILITD